MVSRPWILLYDRPLLRRVFTLPPFNNRPRAETEFTVTEAPTDSANSNPARMSKSRTSRRTLGLFGATSVGIGAIVGGGILALAGAAFAQTGPSAVLAFALNGCIAFLTALSFAEVASKFPESGGTYTFAKKVLSVESAFTVGWIVWFASIVAAVLYALGFAQFAIAAGGSLANSLGWESVATFLNRPYMPKLMAALITIFYTLKLMFRSGGGGNLENIGKLLVFSLLIVLGFWALRDRTFSEVQKSVTPFFANGATGLFQAMGYTFIAVQGFDLIAAVGGEVRQPEKNIPRAMLGSLAIAMIIYLPLLFVIATVGVPTGESITEVSRQNPETIIAIAAENYLGGFGYWLVMIAGLLSMVSAMQANLFAASRVAMAMAKDRTLPTGLGRKNASSQIPVSAVLVTGLLTLILLALLPSLAEAGAASSLIFLITFALAHWICILVRQRSVANPPPFRTWWFPAVPACGGIACLILAVYQGVIVPTAGSITLFWLSLGGLLFLVLFAQRARLSDATNEIHNPELLRLRGRSPLVLVPIANPKNAPALVALASAMTPKDAGRVLLLSIAVAPDEWDFESNPKPLENTQIVLRQAIASSVAEGLYPEALTTIAKDPWQEIRRVSKAHRCESLLLGLTRLTDKRVELPLEQLVKQVACDVVVLRAPNDWNLSDANRILVPTTDHRIQNPLLARILASLSKAREREITFLNVRPQSVTPRELRDAQQELAGWVYNLCSSSGRVQVAANDSPLEEILEQAKESDLMILNIHSNRKDEKLFSRFAWQIIEQTDCPLLIARHY